jgi:hypothetical protein
MRSMRELLTDTIDPDKTVYRGTTMRSKLEAEFAMYLDAQGFVWQYEPAIFGPVGDGYLPDFLIHEYGTHCYIEVKPTLEQANAAKDRMRVIWTWEPDAVLLIVSGDGWWQATAKGRPWEPWRERWHGYKVKKSTDEAA